MERSKEDIKREFGIVERASGSRETQNYEEDPEATHPTKGKRGGAKGPKPRRAKQTEREMRQEIERGFREIEESNLNSAEETAWQKTT